MRVTTSVVRKHALRDSNHLNCDESFKFISRIFLSAGSFNCLQSYLQICHYDLDLSVSPSGPAVCILHIRALWR